MPANIQLVFIENNFSIQFNSWLLTFLRGRCRELLECREVPFSRESSSLTQGLLWHLLKMIASNEHYAPLLIVRRVSFLSASMIRVELIRQPRRRVFVYTVQGRLVLAVYCLIHPDWCPKWFLTMAAATTCWKTGPKTGSLSTGFMWYSMSPGQAYTTLIVAPFFSNYSCFLDATIH